MMQIDFLDQPTDAGLLRSMLLKHNLLYDSLADPMALIAASDGITIGFIHEGGDVPLAIVLENRPCPGVIGVMLITERPKLNQRKAELVEIGKALRERWFEGQKTRRVESRVPVERTQTIRVLKHMGFRVETLPKGLRSAETIKSKPVSFCIMGLLPSDPLRQLPEDHSEPKISGVED